MKKIAFLFFSFWYCFGFGQTQTDILRTEMTKNMQIPKSPEASAFEKYGDVPINLYTGNPNINIPIYTIQGKEMNLPLNFTYDASGIKVNQVSTDVGLGWNLNYGGMITRQVNVLPDRGSGHYIKIYSNQVRNFKADHIVNQNFFSGNSIADVRAASNFYNSYLINNIDYSSDKFNFYVNGLSGTIVIDYQTDGFPAFCIDNPTIKVSYLGTLDGINKWVITDSFGTIYEFSESEITYDDYSTLENEFNYSYKSSWYLTKIISPNKKDTFDFHYSTSSVTDNDRTLPSATKSISLFSYNGGNILYNVSSQITSKTYKIKSKEIFSITYNTDVCSINFYRINNRLDVFGNKKSLNSIEITDNHNKIIKQIELQQSYFTTPLSISNSNFSEYNKRLKLDFIKFGTSSDSEKEIYKFSYIGENQMPERLSKAVDFWGYYNNSNTNSNILENIPSPSPSPNDLFSEMLTTTLPNNIIGNIPYSTRKRASNFAKSTIGSLNKITYPTGGSTVFYYQPHKGPSDSYIEHNGEVNIVSVTLTGGWMDGTEAYNSCDDIGYDLIENNSKTVIINHPNTDLTFSWQVDDNNSAPNPLQPTETRFSYAWMYPIIPEDAHSVNSDYYNRTYCELRDDPTTIKLSDLVNLYDGTGTIHNIPVGAYKIKIANGKEGSISSLNIAKIEDITRDLNNTVGGQRIYKIEQRTNNNDIVKIKYYYYNQWAPYFDIQNLDLEMCDQLFFNQSISNSIIHQKLKFFERKTINKLNMQSLLGRSDYTEYTLSSENLALKTRYNITYTNVNEFEFKNNLGHLIPEGYTKYTFYNADEGGYSNENQFSKNILNGQLEQTEYFKFVQSPSAINGYMFKPVKKIRNNYSIDFFHNDLLNDIYIISNNNITPDISSPVCRDFVYNSPNNYSLSYTGILGGNAYSCNPTGTNIDYFKSIALFRKRYKYRLLKLNSIISENYFNNDVVISTTNNFYDNPTHHQITKTETSTSNNNDVMITEIYYADEMLNQGIDVVNMQEFIDNNRISVPIKKNTYKNTYLLSTEKTKFKKWVHSNLLLPERLQSKKGSSNLEDRVIYHNYDEMGNPIEISKKDGSHTCYIWGYNKSRIIAKIENKTENDISTFISNLQNLSNLDDDNCRAPSCNEEKLRVALNNLRNDSLMDDAIITTYTYDPLVGVTSICSANGDTQYYYYDNFNKLKFIKDADQNILKSYEHHYVDMPTDGGGNDSSCNNVLDGFILTLNGANGNDLMPIAILREFNILNLSGGSGNYTYFWEILNTSGVTQNSNYTNSGSSYGVDFLCSRMNNVNNVKVRCTITDNDNPNICPLVLISDQLACD